MYFSRSAWKKGNPDFGEHLIEKAFYEKYHCEIIHPEQLSFVDMVKILQETRTLITTEGSVSHNSLFMQPGSELIIIRKAGFVSYYQLMINQIKDLRVTYIDAHQTHYFYDKETPYYGPFFLYVNNSLAQFLKIKAHFPLLTYIRYRMNIVLDKMFKICLPVFVRIKHLCMCGLFKRLILNTLPPQHPYIDTPLTAYPYAMNIQIIKACRDDKELRNSYSQCWNLMAVA